MNILLVAFTTLIASFQSLFSKLFSGSYQSEDADQTSTVFSITYGLFAAVATIIIAGFHFAPSPMTILFGLINAVMLFVYNMSMIKASRTGSYSIQMLSLLFGGLVMPMVFNALFMGERLSALQFIAIGIVMVSFVLMNLTGLSFKGLSRKFILWCTLLFFSNGFFCIVLNAQQKALSGAERNEMIIIVYGVMALLYIVLQLFKSPKVLISGFRMDLKSLAFLLLCCASATTASHFTLYVLSKVDATIVFAFSNGGVLVLSVLYSWVLFKERLSKVQWLGVALATASIVMLSV